MNQNGRRTPPCATQLLAGPGADPAVPADEPIA